MKSYFALQYRMFNRTVKDWGISPLLVHIALPIIFVVVSNTFFTKIYYEGYGYIAFLGLLLMRLSEKKRNTFLKTIYTASDYNRLRIYENVLLSIPFILFSLYKSQFLCAGIALLIAIMMAVFNVNINVTKVIPTPFGKRPFEFLVGFRQQILLFLLVYFLTFMSIYVGNFNLGAFSIIAVALISLQFYNKPEHEFFVWNFDLSPKAFLHLKIKESIIHVSYLILPIFIALAIAFTTQVWMLLLVVLMAYVLMLTIVVAKYSTYPVGMHIPQGLLLALCVIFTPLLLIAIPLLYQQSIKRLTETLYK